MFDDHSTTKALPTDPSIEIELVEKTKDEGPAKSIPDTTLSLRDQLILFLFDYQEKNKTTETLKRIKELLKKVGLLENENETLSAIIEVINDFSETSLLGNSKNLRGELSKLLCKHLGIHKETVDKNLHRIHASTEPGLMPNLIMHRLINARHKGNADVQDEKEFSQNKQLAEFRETLHYYISLLFVSDAGEQEEALSFLTEIYRNTITLADLITLIKKKMKNDAGFTRIDSRLLYYINHAVISYLKIPEEEFCLEIMNTCRRQNQTTIGTSPLHPVMLDDSSTPMMAWHIIYNISVVPIILQYLYAVTLTEIKTEAPKPVTQKDSLQRIMLEKIALYEKKQSPGLNGLQRISDLKEIVEKAENEDVLLSQMKTIYDDFSDDSFLKTDNALRHYTRDALAEFFGITAGQVAVQEYDTYKKPLLHGDRLDYTHVRDTAIRALVNKATKQQYPALAEVKAKAPKASLKTKLISCITEGSTSKLPREKRREAGLLEQITPLTKKPDVLSAIIDTINDFKTDSLLGMGNTSPLRLEISKLICEDLGITEDSIQDEQKKNNEKPVFIMHRLINKKYAEDQKFPYELVRLREILDRHLSQFLTIGHSRLSATKEEEKARGLLPYIYKIPSEGNLCCMILEDFFLSTKLRLDSELFASINEALYEYLHIPAAAICKLMVRGIEVAACEEKVRPEILYYRTFNRHMVSLINPFLTRREITWESTPPVITTPSLGKLIKKYIDRCKPYLEKELSFEIKNSAHGQIRCLMETIKEKEQEGEVVLLNEMVRIYNSSLPDSYNPYIRLAIEDALLEHLGITDDDICVRQFQDCKQALKNGLKDPEDVFLRENRARATHKLINNAAQARQDIEEMTSTLTSRLMGSIMGYRAKCEDRKDQASVMRINALLTKIMENAVQDESVQLKESVAIFNNQEDSSLLSDDIKLRHLMGKTLCEALNIKRESSFMENSTTHTRPLRKEVEDMQELIRVAYLEQVVTKAFDGVKLHLPR